LAQICDGHESNGAEDKAAARASRRVDELFEKLATKAKEGLIRLQELAAKLKAEEEAEGV